MKDFLTCLFFMKIQYTLTFHFFKNSFFSKLLKIFLIILFIIPTFIFSLITIIFGAINILLRKIIIIGAIWGLLTGLFNAITMLLFRLCNLSELNQYKNCVSNNMNL